MRVSTKFLGFIINFLLGVAWALVAIGAAFGFLTGIKYGFFYAVIFTFVGSLFGLFFVTLLEFFFLRLDKYVEMQKQTKILSDILKGIEK